MKMETLDTHKAETVQAQHLGSQASEIDANVGDVSLENGFHTCLSQKDCTDKEEVHAVEVNLPSKIIKDGEKNVVSDNVDCNLDLTRVDDSSYEEENIKGNAVEQMDRNISDPKNDVEDKIVSQGDSPADTFFGSVENEGEVLPVLVPSSTIGDLASCRIDVNCDSDVQDDEYHSDKENCDTSTVLDNNVNEISSSVPLIAACSLENASKNSQDIEIPPATEINATLKREIFQRDPTLLKVETDIETEHDPLMLSTVKEEEEVSIGKQKAINAESYTQKRMHIDEESSNEPGHKNGYVCPKEGDDNGLEDNQVITESNFLSAPGMADDGKQKIDLTNVATPVSNDSAVPCVKEIEETNESSSCEKSVDRLGEFGESNGLNAAESSDIHPFHDSLEPTEIPDGFPIASGITEANKNFQNVIDNNASIKVNIGEEQIMSVCENIESSLTSSNNHERIEHSRKNNEPSENLEVPLDSVGAIKAETKQVDVMNATEPMEINTLQNPINQPHHDGLDVSSPKQDKPSENKADVLSNHEAAKPSEDKADILSNHGAAQVSAEKDDAMDCSTSVQKGPSGEEASCVSDANTVQHPARILTTSEDEDEDNPSPLLNVDEVSNNDSGNEETPEPARVPPVDAVADGPLPIMADNILAVAAVPAMPVVRRLRPGALAGINYNDLEEIIVQKVCECISERCPEVGEFRRRIQFMEVEMAKWKNRALGLEKQMRDHRLIMDKFRADCEQAAADKSHMVIPVRVTRSVGLQVSIGNKIDKLAANPGPKSAASTVPNNTTAPGAAKKLAEKSSPIVRKPGPASKTINAQKPTPSPKPAPLSPARPAVKQVLTPKPAPPVKHSPIAVKSTKSMRPKAPSLVETNSPIAKPPALVKAPFPPKTSTLVTPNVIVRPTAAVTANRTPSKPSPVIDILDLTDDEEVDEPAAKVPKLSPRTKQIKPITSATLTNTQGKVLQVISPIAQNQSGSTLAYVLNSSQVNTRQISANRPSSAPTPPPLLFKGGNNQRQFNAMQTSPRPQVSVAPNNNWPLRHPAPLPNPPVNQPHEATWKLRPPRPTLKISIVSSGIVLSWDMTLSQEHEAISSYQLVAYQEGQSPPSTSLWKRVGDVKALPLPMACTLTQFVPGHKYHFAVRAVDVHMRVGQFSFPGTILLVK